MLIEFEEYGDNFIWNDGACGRFLKPEVSGEYIVQFNQIYTNCLLTYTINIEIEDCIATCKIWFPTGFSPGSSLGVNDIFRIKTSCTEGFSFFEMQIYNRWGELIFFSNNEKNGWNGTYKNSQCEMGASTYVIDYSKKYNNQKESISGLINLIR